MARLQERPPARTLFLASGGVSQAAGATTGNLDGEELLQPFAQVVVDLGPGQSISAPMSEEHARRFQQIVTADPKLAALAAVEKRAELMAALAQHPEARLIVRDMIRHALAKARQDSGSILEELQPLVTPSVKKAPTAGAGGATPLVVVE